MWEQFKRIHAAPAESEWKSVIVGMTEPISDQLTTEPGHGRLGLLEGRRSIVRQKSAELRAEHPALPEVLRDFQVRGAGLIVAKELIGY